MERLNFGHADADADHSDGAGHAHGARAAHYDRRKVRLSCLQRLVEPQWPKFSRSLLIVGAGAEIRCSRNALYLTGLQPVPDLFWLSCCCCVLPQSSAVITAASGALRRPTPSFSLSHGDPEQLRYVSFTMFFAHQCKHSCNSDQLSLQTCVQVPTSPSLAQAQ